MKIIIECNDDKTFLLAEGVSNLLSFYEQECLDKTKMYYTSKKRYGSFAHEAKIVANFNFEFWPEDKYDGIEEHLKLSII